MPTPPPFHIMSTVRGQVNTEPSFRATRNLSSIQAKCAPTQFPGSDLAVKRVPQPKRVLVHPVPPTREQTGPLLVEGTAEFPQDLARPHLRGGVKIDNLLEHQGGQMLHKLSQSVGRVRWVAPTFPRNKFALASASLAESIAALASSASFLARCIFAS